MEGAELHVLHVTSNRGCFHEGKKTKIGKNIVLMMYYSTSDSC